MAEIEGTVTLDSVAAEVPVLALAEVGGNYQILDSTISAPDGTYGLDPGASSIVIALGGNGSAQGVVSAGALWTPAEIATALWLDAEDAGTITEVSGAVSQWDDKSGSGFSFSQPTASLRPLTGSHAQNGRNVLRFEGDYLVSDSPASTWNFLHGAARHQIYVVARSGVTADPNNLHGVMGTLGLTTASRNGLALWFDDRAAVSRNDSFVHLVGPAAGLGTNVVSAPTTNGSAPSNSHILLSIEADYGNATPVDRSAIYPFGGVAQKNNSGSVTPSGSNAHSTLQIGAAGAAGAPMTGEIAELVVVVGSPDMAMRQRIEGYLAWKWGLEANLPSGHPYKSAAPTA